MKVPFFAALLLALSPAQAQQEHDHHELGTVDFKTSCNVEAQRAVTRGVAWLHSFEYEEAEKSFAGAAAVDPKCGMAQWGIAMSNYHPLWAAPAPGELEKGRAAIARGKSIGAPTARERDYIAALDLFYANTDRLNHGARTIAYTDAMERLHRSHPGDQEAAVFFALALIAAGTLDSDPSFAREIRAAGLLNQVLARQPNHPGVVHYLIHSYDYPALAHLALPAARAYAGIAPASAHAQHMPSHIFTRLGLWDEAIRSNLAAEAAAKAYAVRHGMTGAWDEQLHADDYLAYGYLQLAQDRKAEELIAALNRIERVDPPNFKVAFAFSAAPARFVLERRRWSEAAALTLPDTTQKAVNWAAFPWARAHLHFARAVGAARSGDTALARSEVANLAQIRQATPARPGEYDWGVQVEIEHGIAAAWLAAAEDRMADAIALMRTAAALDDRTEKHPVTPGAILPAREQLGEMLLEAGKPAEALAAFETSLSRAPGRFNGLYGAARAAQRSGATEQARRYYGTLLAICKASQCDRPEIREATAFLG
jgi:tetratricopeptide (TPR) repeat protein